MGKNRDIESLFRDEFRQLELEPSSGFWKELKQKLFWKEFLQFSLTRFNIYYLSALITGLVIITYTNFHTPETAIISVETKSFDQTDNTIRESPTSVSQQDAVSPVEKQVVSPGASGTNRAVRRQQKESADRLSEQTNIEKKESNLFKQDKQEQGKSLTLTMPMAAYTVSVNEGCLPLTVYFTNLSENAGEYKWMFGDGGTSYDLNPSYIYDEAGVYPVSLRVTNQNGEDMVVSDTIRVYDLPEAVFEVYPEYPDIPAEPVNFYNYSKNAVKYFWDFGDNTNSEEAEPLHYYGQEGTYNIKLTVWSIHGCVDTAGVKDAFAGEECSLVFPNAFSPNPGGPTEGYYNPSSLSNEIFYPICKGVEEYHLRIFSRSGALVFETDDVSLGWDGYINGTLARQDVYVWKVRGRFSNGKSFVRFGNVTLIRKY